MAIQKKTLIIGAGVTGLSFANRLLELGKTRPEEILILEQADEPGGYCRSIKKSGFVWDYAGHFFHFRHPHVHNWLKERMPDVTLRHVEKISQIYIDGHTIDFPFQKNIHQLPREQFIECLSDLYAVSKSDTAQSHHSFEARMRAQLGDGIVDLFLKPYNEKLYACDINTLDEHAMGRFLPQTSFEEVMAHMQAPDNSSYNGTFSYPLEGAYSYIEALCRDIPAECLRLNTQLTTIQADEKYVVFDGERIDYDNLISTMPLPRLAAAVGYPASYKDLTWNAVEVLNIGFDKPSKDNMHWVYYPEHHVPFYRVGFYDNIHDSDRMSLYIEYGRPSGQSTNPQHLLEQTLVALKDVGVVDDHRLVDWAYVKMDPAYVHLRPDTEVLKHQVHNWLRQRDILSCGRYGQWRYCSIEDNIIEAWALADELDIKSV